jgi:hypothetical protein
MLEKQFNKLVDQIVKTAITAELTGITKEEVINRYNKVLEEYGIEKADSALENTLNQFNNRIKTIKEKKRMEDKKFWQEVKNETFNKKGFCPCAIRDLKNSIKSGEIDITGFEKEQEIKQRLAI